MKTSLLISIGAVVFIVALVAGSVPVDAWDNLLQNPGFEDGVVGWQTHGSTFSRLSFPVHGGDFCAALTSDSGQSNWIYQVIRIVPGESYTFSGWVARNAPDEKSAVYLSLSWYVRDDGFGSELQPSSESVHLLQNNSEFQLLTLAAVAPEDTRFAIVKAVVESAHYMTAVAYFDDLAFTGPAPQVIPEPEPTPSITPTQTPAPTLTPSVTPIPTAIPSSTPTPSIKQKPLPTSAASATPIPTAMPASTPTPAPTSTPRPSSTPEAPRDAVPTETTMPAPSISPAGTADSTITAYTPTPGTISGPTPSSISLPTQTPQTGAQDHTWLYIGLPSLISFVGLSSLGFVLFLRRR